MLDILQHHAPILVLAKIALNQLWILDKAYQQVLMQTDPSLSKSTAQKLAISWGTNILQLQLIDKSLYKKLHGIIYLWERFTKEV